VLRFIRERRVSDEKFPGKMLERPAVGFNQLMLCERNRLKITRFGGTVTAVGQSKSEILACKRQVSSVSDKL
jgi:hypothetical protein